MITQKTVFVVGAGGSKVYGLPVASEISAQAKALDSTGDLYQLLHNAVDDTLGTLDQTLEDLKRHPGESIDAYLEHRQHDDRKMRVGKALMAALLGTAIVTRKGNNPPSKDDWILRIVDKMSRRAPRASDFAAGAKNVSFVTFNFDSIIEERIADILNDVYPNDDTREAAEAIEVIHLHGRLPGLPNEPVSIGETRVEPGYSWTGLSSKWKSWVMTASKEIRVVIDDIDQELVNRAQLRVRAANVLCFLGFSYGTENLDRLGIPTCLNDMQAIFGSALGLRGAKRGEISDKFRPARIQLASTVQTCMDVLQSHILRE